MSNRYQRQPLTPLRRALARFSLSETARYTKLTLGLWIGFGIPYLLGFPDAAVPLAGSTMLTLALGSSISAARSYFYKRVFSNVVAMPIGTLLIWLSTNLKQAHLLLKTDLEQAWVSPHLKRNAARLPMFACYQETFDSLVNFLETMDTFHDQFAALDAAWREMFLARLARLVSAHRQLAEAADLRVERPPLDAPPLHIEDLRQLTEDLPASNVFTSVYLGHLTGYGILLCRLSELHTA
ncbi:hypothetical protein [Paraburkholderia youngii]|uniref:hypothetical protein n=1 Tax=Paraburkholderia youngii TaxID=2782701 RepID=UPI003D23B866